MKAMLKRMLRPFYRGTKKILRPFADRLRGPLSRLLYPPEFETVFRNLEQISNNLKGYIDQSDQMLLAMFRTLHLPAAPPSQSSVAPISLGNGRILTRHSSAAMLFVDANDLHHTPRILLNDYEVHVTEALRRIVRPGDNCVDVGAGIGYHTLTMAAAAGGDGRVLAVELEEQRATLLHDNLTANELGDRCEHLTSNEAAFDWLKSKTSDGLPDVVRIGSGLDLNPWRDLLAGWTREGSTCFVLSTRADWTKIDEMQSLSFWRIAGDGALFRSDRDEIEELGRRQETHFVAARALR